MKEAAGRLPAGGVVAELASGEGRNAVYLAQRGHTVHAVDLAAEGIRKTAQLAAEAGVSERVLAEEGALAASPLARPRPARLPALTPAADGRRPRQATSPPGSRPPGREAWTRWSASFSTSHRPHGWRFGSAS